MFGNFNDGDRDERNWSIGSFPAVLLCMVNTRRKLWRHINRQRCVLRNRKMFLKRYVFN